LDQAGEVLGKRVGEWFGPSTMAHVIKDLVAERHKFMLSVYVSNEGTIYRDQVRKMAREAAVVNEVVPPSLPPA